MKKNTLVSSEEDEQIAVIQYCDLLGIPVMHTANEGKRSAAYGARLKRMGLRPGFPDLLITRARGVYHGFAIEMKYGNNKPTKDQIEWLRTLKYEGYATAVCYSASEAIKLIDKYLAQNEEEKCDGKTQNILSLGDTKHSGEYC